ncbi:MAG: hypothetical protein LBJ41_04925 [Treponema sp.]|jgi:hypothetical protein|nr:hypothetical protein [Treponema sp.]
MSYEERRKAAYSLIPQDAWQAAKFFREFWENYLTSLFVVSRIVTMNREERRKAAYSLIPQKVWYNVLLMQNKSTPPPPPVPLKVSFSFYYYTFGFLIDWLNSLYCLVFKTCFTGVLYSHCHGISVYMGHHRRGVSFRR